MDYRERRKKKRVFVSNVFHNIHNVVRFAWLTNTTENVIKLHRLIDFFCDHRFGHPESTRSKYAYLTHCSPQEVRLDIKFKFCVTYAKVDISNLQKEYRTAYDVYQSQKNTI